MKKMQLVERILGTIVGICCIVNLVYCFVDAPSGISRIALISICLVRQSLLFVPLVICGLIDLISWILKESKEDKKEELE